MSGAELVGQAGSLGLVLVVVDQPSRVALAVPHWSGRGVHKGGVGDRVGRIRSLRVRHGAQVFLDKSAGFKIKSKLFSFLFKMFRLFQQPSSTRMGAHRCWFAAHGTRWTHAGHGRRRRRDVERENEEVEEEEVGGLCYLYQHQQQQ